MSIESRGERRHRPTDTDNESAARSRMNTNGEGSVDRNAGTTEVDERIVFELLRKYACETDVSVPLLMLLRRQRERRSMQDANAAVRLIQAKWRKRTAIIEAIDDELVTMSHQRHPDSPRSQSPKSGAKAGARALRTKTA